MHVSDSTQMLLGTDEDDNVYPFKQNKNMLKTWKCYYIHISKISP